MIYLIKKYLIILQIFPIIFLLSNCSSFNKKVDTTKPTDIEIYSKGLESLKKGNFKRVRLFDDHVGNLKSFMKLKDKFPEVDFLPFLVTGDKVKKYA